MKRLPAERLLTSVLALMTTGAFFCEYLPPFTRARLFSDIGVYHDSLQRYVFHALKDGCFPDSTNSSD
jgi:hypothetical protein